MRAAGQLAARRLPFCAAPPTGGDSAAPHATKKKKTNSSSARPPAAMRSMFPTMYHRVQRRSNSIGLVRKISFFFVRT
jgi:hypothetical protein